MDNEDPKPEWQWSDAPMRWCECADCMDYFKDLDAWQVREDAREKERIMADLEAAYKALAQTPYEDVSEEVLAEEDEAEDDSPYIDAYARRGFAIQMAVNAHAPYCLDEGVTYDPWTTPKLARAFLDIMENGLAADPIVDMKKVH